MREKSKCNTKGCKTMAFRTLECTHDSEKFEVACCDGNIEEVKRLFDTCTDYSIGSAFSKASQNSRIDVIDFFISKNIKRNYVHYAVCDGNVEMSLFLYDRGFFHKEYALSQVFETACVANCVKTVEWVMSKGLTRLKNGFEWACRSGSIDVVKMIVSKGYSDFDDGFYEACHYRHRTIIKFLVEECHFTNFKRGFELSCLFGHLDIIKYIVSQGFTDYNQGFENAFERHACSVVKYLLELFIPDKKDLLACAIGNIPLIVESSATKYKVYESAVVYNHINLVNYVYPQLDEYYLKDSVFEKACSWNRLEIVKCLVETYQYDKFERGFYYACCQGAIDVVKYLVSKGWTDFTEGFEYGCSEGRIVVIKYLASQGFKPQDNTALRYACCYNQYECIKFLSSFNLSLEFSLNNKCKCEAIKMFKHLLECGVELTNYREIREYFQNDTDIRCMIELSKECFSDKLVRSIQYRTLTKIFGINTIVKHILEFVAEKENVTVLYVPYSPSMLTHDDVTLPSMLTHDDVTLPSNVIRQPSGTPSLVNRFLSRLGFNP